MDQMISQRADDYFTTWIISLHARTSSALALGSSRVCRPNITARRPYECAELYEQPSNGYFWSIRMCCARSCSPREVRCGSNSDLSPCLRHDRFALKSGHD